MSINRGPQAPVLFCLHFIADLNEGPFRPNKRKAREHPMSIGACVDADASWLVIIGEHFRSIDDGVAMNNYLAVVTTRIQKRFANPDQIVF